MAFYQKRQLVPSLRRTITTRHLSFLSAFPALAAPGPQGPTLLSCRPLVAIVPRNDTVLRQKWLHAHWTRCRVGSDERGRCRLGVKACCSTCMISHQLFLYFSPVFKEMPCGRLCTCSRLWHAVCLSNTVHTSKKLQPNHKRKKKKSHSAFRSNYRTQA